MTSGVPTLAVRVGQRLRALREEQRLTQEMLAARLTSEWKEVSPKTLSAWETGRTPLPLVAFEAVAAALRLDPAYLGQRLGLCGEPTPRELFIPLGANVYEALANEPPEVQAAVAQTVENALEIARAVRLARTN